MHHGLADQERVAVGESIQRRHQAVVLDVDSFGGEQLRRLAVTEGGQGDDRRLPLEAVEELFDVVPFTVTAGAPHQHDDHTGAIDARGEETGEEEGRRVAGLGVVDDDHHGRVVGETREVFGDGRESNEAIGIERATADIPGEQVGGLVAAELGEHVRPGPQRRGATLCPGRPQPMAKPDSAATLCRSGAQRGLADTRRATDHDQPPSTLPRLGARLGDGCQLDGAADEGTAAVDRSSAHDCRASGRRGCDADEPSCSDPSTGADGHDRPRGHPVASAG